MLTDPIYSDIWDAGQAAEAASLRGPILVVGASGFIGAKLFFSLLQRRDDVFAACPHPAGSWRLSDVPNKQLVSLDITKGRELKDAISWLKPRTIFNLSAYGGYERQSDAVKIHEVNYTGTFNLIRSLMDFGCDAFVQAGTSSEYGVNCAAPSEEGRLEPNSDYAVSKAGASYLVGYYGRFKALPAAVLRLYSIYGPWEERDRLIPRLIEEGLRKKFPPFADARISRDFVYVDDATSAFVKAALTACKNQKGAVFNIATGRATSLEEISGVIGKLFAIPEKPVFASMPNRKWDLSNWYGDPKRAAAELGWTAGTGLEKGLELSRRWEEQARSKIDFGRVHGAPSKISAIVACYKDAQAIPIMHQRLTQAMAALDIDYELIFVNDGSPAGDGAAIGELCAKDPHVIGIHHSRNFGSQAAFLSGMGAASGDAVVIMDGDLQDPPELIGDFYRKWKEGFDIVYGQRIKRDAPVHMQLLYKAFYRLFRSLADVNIPLDAGDFSLMDRKVADALLAMPEKDVFLRGLRAWVGFRQTGVDYKRPERMFGVTTNSFGKNIWWAKKGIFSFSIRPLEYIQRLGVLVFISSILLSVFYLAVYFLNPAAHAGGKGITSVVLLVLGLGGVQIISLSVVGDYIGKILEEVKNRPRFIRSMIVRGSTSYATQQEMAKFIVDNRAR